MESQVTHPVGHTYDQDPHNVGLHSVVEGEGHEHHEKASVLKKVKDKAKKIKHKLHLDGHGHEHEHGNKLEHEFAQDARGGYEEDDDEDDEEEEMVQDPEIHGAPMYESSAIRSSNLPAQPQAPSFEHSTVTAEHRRDYPMTPATSMKETNPGHHSASSPPQIGDLIPLQEDPHAPNPAGRISPPNYESKVSDPTGGPGKVADINPTLIPTGEPRKAADMDPSLISSLDKMTISDQNPTGSHDQSVSAGQTSYAQKMTLAPSMIADKAVSVKNAVASKLGYGEGGNNNPGPGATEYVQKVTATVTGTLAPVYQRVADAGSSVVSKVRGGGGGAAAVPDKGVSVTEYLAEKLRPGEDDKALSSMISDKLHLSKAGESHPTPVGRVTESEVVRRDLGTGMENRREGADAIAAGKENTGGGGSGSMVDKLKGAVTSWMGKQVEQDYSGAADSPSQERKEGGEIGEKTEFGTQDRKLQESGN